LLVRAAPPDEDVALLTDLLSLPGSERHPLSNRSPQRKKERTTEALIRQLEVLANQQPVMWCSKTRTGSTRPRASYSISSSSASAACRCC
jgi:hypothetical protein